MWKERGRERGEDIYIERETDREEHGVFLVICTMMYDLCVPMNSN